MKKTKKIWKYLLFSLLIPFCFACSETNDDIIQDVPIEIEQQYGLSIVNSDNYQCRAYKHNIQLNQIETDDNSNKYIEGALSTNYRFYTSRDETLEIHYPILTKLENAHKISEHSMFVNGEEIQYTSIDSKYYHDSREYFGEDFEKIASVIDFPESNALKKYTLTNNEKKTVEFNFVIRDFDVSEDMIICSKPLNYSYYKQNTTKSVECQIVLEKNQTVELYVGEDSLVEQGTVEKIVKNEYFFDPVSTSLNEYIEGLVGKYETTAEIIRQCIANALYTREFKHIEITEENIINYLHKSHVFILTYNIPVEKNQTYDISIIRNIRLYWVNDGYSSSFAIGINDGSRAINDSYKRSVCIKISITPSIKEELIIINECKITGEYTYEVSLYNVIEFTYIENEEITSYPIDQNLNTVMIILGLLSIVGVTVLVIVYAKKGGQSK